MTDVFDPHSGSLLLEEGVQQAEIIVNRAIQTLGALGQLAVISGLTTNGNTPPGSPNDGDVYFTGSSSTGAWDDHDNEFAQYIGSLGAWFFVAAKEGWTSWDKSSNKRYRFQTATTKVEVALQQELSISGTIVSPSGTEDRVLKKFLRASTVTRIELGVRGSSSPSITVTFRKASDRSAAGTEVVTGGTTVTNTTTGQSVTSFNSASIAANNHFWLETTAISGTVDELYYTIYYTEDG
jgi:hypothetical protein